jgi:hypothetical protein
MIEIRRLGPNGLLGILSTSFSPVLRDECKRTPGMVWNPETVIWEGYTDAVALVAARARERGLIIKDPAKFPLTATVLPVATKDLREYQIEGVNFILNKAREGCLLGDTVGLGKTAQAIRAARAIKQNTLIVCPSFVRGVWVDELKKWWPDADAPNLPSGVKVPEGSLGNTGCVTVIHYDILYAWVPELLKWGVKFLVLDEAQYCQGATSRRTKACAAVAAQASWRVGLTGTPMANRPADLWAVVETLSPGRFGKFFNYGMRYCTPPEAPVWMGDLSFKPIGEIKAGDTVIGWRRGTAKAKTKSELVRTRVVRVQRRIAPLVKVTLESGRTIRCTPDHRWMSGKHTSKKFPWCSVRVGRALAHVVTDPGSVSPTLEHTAAWLGGIYDGEGSCPGRGTGISIAQSPTHNPDVYAAIEQALGALGFAYSLDDVQKTAEKFRIIGGRQKVLDFLTWCRPVRRRRLEEAILCSKFRTPDKIVSVEPDGIGEVVSLKTEAGNYVVYGYASSNCDGHREQLTPEKAVWKFDGASHLEELNTRLKSFMLRRTRADVALQLPSRQRQILSLEVPRAKYTPQMIGSHTALRKALEGASDAKIPAVIDLVVGHLEAGHKVVVGSHRKALAHMIHDGVRQKMPVRSEVVTGEIPTAKRHAIIKSQPELICCTFDATQVGIDLSFASVGVVAEFDYRPSVLAQWEGRFGRFAGRNILIQYCSARGTIDDLIRKAVITKLDTLENAVGKADVAMRADLEAIDGASGLDRLRALAETLMNGDDE